MSARARAHDAQPDGEAGHELALLWPLLGRHIAFHRRLVDITRSVKAALLLSQMIYWTRHGRDIAARDGWFHKTARQWELETALTAREQAHAKKKLLALDLIEERLSGAPALLHFRLVPERLAALVAQLLGRPAAHLDWADGNVVFDLLGPPLAYHRALAAASGGVHAGLLLSRALYLTRYSPGKIRNGWFYAPLKFWVNETGLGRRGQETARRALVGLGLWEEDLRGIPPHLYMRVRTTDLLARLGSMPAGAARARRRIRADEISEGGNTTFKREAKPPSSQRGLHLQASTKTPNQCRQNRPDSFDQSAQSNIVLSTRCLVQTPPPPPPPPAPCHADERTGATQQAGGGDLILPQQLLPEERTAALILVSRCPSQAQALCDELAARLLKHSVHSSPIAYLRGMVQRALAGVFVPELGAPVAAARRKAVEDAARRQQREAEAQRLAAEQSSPGYQAAVAARRTQVRELLERMRSRSQTQPAP